MVLFTLVLKSKLKVFEIEVPHLVNNHQSNSRSSNWIGPDNFVVPQNVVVSTHNI